MVQIPHCPRVVGFSVVDTIRMRRLDVIPHAQLAAGCPGSAGCRCNAIIFISQTAQTCHDRADALQMNIMNYEK